MIFGGFCVYDDPTEAYQLGTITSPYLLDRDDWEQWKREHYVGAAGYDCKTGKIINAKQRAIFDRMHPNFEQEQLRKKGEIFDKEEL